jgi:hypothetical protein
MVALPIIRYDHAALEHAIAAIRRGEVNACDPLTFAGGSQDPDDWAEAEQMYAAEFDGEDIDTSYDLLTDMLTDMEPFDV